MSGLGGGSLVLQLNGGGDLVRSVNGSYAFATRLVDGANYVVTVKTQPQGHWCTLTHASGTVQGADVTNVDASCAPLAAELHLDVDDGYAFARYGYVRDYFVTLGNTGNRAANSAGGGRRGSRMRGLLAIVPAGQGYGFAPAKGRGGVRSTLDPGM